MTFAIHTGDNSSEKLSLDHMQVFFDKLTKVQKKMKEAHFSQKMINRKFEGHYSLTKVHNKNIVSYSIIETVIMVMILTFQFFYIRSLISKVD